ncbi:unnamed protein product [Blumeria hordei]|uniref:Anaphase-promoting complex subunit 4-like WD40 domain-containing protein n=1 Tax=Blumeria hordei TaxID=2867405 RepID=A0A383V257_BLUHO|nr:unnamed protein product [Blumeria hordei]
MADFGAFPPNMMPQNAMIIRQQASEDHAVVPYTADNLSRALQGPANPFKDDTSTSKRKNVLTGYAEETFISEYIFRSKLREMERGPDREYKGGAADKEESAKIRSKRQKKGDSTVAEGDGAYVGPWAKYDTTQYEDVRDGDDKNSDDEYEEVSQDEYIESGTVVPALPEALAKRKEVEELGDETSVFEGSQLHDYQGRTYMHVPQDLDIDLRSERIFGEFKNYVPKKMIHQWKGHTKPICGLRLFPDSGHLLLSGSADTTVKIWDIYHDRELLRTYKGHNKALSDITFNASGRQFLSASYDRMIKLWDTETGQCTNRFTTGKTPHVIKFNPSLEHSHEFLVGLSDKKIIQFDTRTGNIVQEYDHHLAAINTITFVDENRRFMTTSDDKSLRAWDYNIPVPIKYIAEPHMYPLTRASLHPSGKYVAYQSSDNNIFVYGANDKFRQNRRKAFKGHNTSGYAVDVACSPDGQFVASGDSGGYVCFWDWKTGKMWHKLQAAEGAVTCVAWHPRESSRVVTAGLEGTIKYWD